MALLPPDVSLVDGQSGHPSWPAVDAYRCGANRFDDEGDQPILATLETIVPQTSPP
jgi:hypothetical protein